MKHTLLFFLFLALAISLSATSERMVVRIDNPDQVTLNRFLAEGADIAAYKAQVYLDLVIATTDLDRLRLEFPSIHVTQTEAQLKRNLLPDRDIPGYTNYSQMVSELMQLQAQYPSLMQTSIIGAGWGSVYAAQNISAYQNFDHDLWAVKVSANVMVEEDEPAFYFVGEHHAREPLSTQVCMGILSYLLENYGTDPLVTQIMNTTEIWIVPLLNPDGHKIVLDQTDVWWRKNLRDNNDSHTFNHDNSGYGADGVDLNRNYSYYWGYTSATDDEDSATYHGLTGFSEPETQAFRDLMLSKRFLAGISYHTYGEWVLYPYGYVSGIIAPDGPEMAALANEMAAVLPSISGGGNYDPSPSWELYPVSGSSDDWIYGLTGAFAYTIEMAQEFIPSATQVASIVPNQVISALTLLQRKDYKMLKGHITDCLTGTPLVATIYIDGFDDNPVYRIPIKSDSLFGAYYRFLPAGTYNVRYLCPGYETVTRTVTVDLMSATIEDVAMTPSQVYQLTIQVNGDFFGPISGANLFFDNTPEQVYTSDTYGNIVIQNFSAGQYQITVSKPGYETLHIMRNIASPSISLRITSQAMLTEDFELNMSNWVATGSWGRTNTQNHYSTYSLADSPTTNYQNDVNTTCRLSAPLNLQNVQNANLQFWLKTVLALDEDCLLLEYSLNGSNWNVMDFYSCTQDWTLKSINLNSFLGQNLYIRYRFISSSYTTANGVFIDDFKLFTNADVTNNEDSLMPALQVSLSAGPNPFTDNSKITLQTNKTLPNSNISVYNLKGQLVKSFPKENLTKGTHSFTWNGLDDNGVPTSSGIYLIRVCSPAGTLSLVKIARIK